MSKLHIKHRQRKLSHIVGNEELIETIQELMKQEDRPQTYLLSGPRGCGKTTIAKIMAKEFGSKGRDIKLLNIGNTGGVEEARRIDQECHYAPQGKAKTYILDECQRGSAQFFDALLRVTEEPPANVYFVFATTQKEKLPAPLQSRCSLKNLPVKLLKDTEMEILVKMILKKEGKDFSSKTVKMIIESAEGSPREALVCLNEIINLSDKQAQKILLKYSYEEDKNVALLCREMIKANWKECSRLIPIIEKSGLDSESVRRIILRYFQKALLGSGKEQFAEILDCFTENTWNCGWPGLSLWIYEACQNYK